MEDLIARLEKEASQHEQKADNAREAALTHARTAKQIRRVLNEVMKIRGEVVEVARARGQHGGARVGAGRTPGTRNRQHDEAIAEYLQSRQGEEVPASEIARATGLTQGQIKQPRQRLIEQGLVKAIGNGPYTRYTWVGNDDNS